MLSEEAYADALERVNALLGRQIICPQEEKKKAPPLQWGFCYVGKRKRVAKLGGNGPRQFSTGR